jgi:hypothetical protein
VFATIIYDALAGLGCVTFAFGLTALAGFFLALYLGLLPGVAARLRRFGKTSHDRAEGES